MSTTFTLTGNASNLSCDIFPEVILDENSEYSCALLDLTTYHSIPNVIEGVNNSFYIYTKKDGTTFDNLIREAVLAPLDLSSDGRLEDTMNRIDLPTGTYEAVEILNLIKERIIQNGFSFHYEINKHTFKTKIRCSTAIYTGGSLSNNILRKVFGFQCDIIRKNTLTEAEDVIKIANQDVVRVECNITTGAYLNGRICHTIYEFATYKADIGHKIIEQPKNLIYLPVTQKRINHIEISLVDQNGDLIDFRGETITCRIHVKRN